MTDRNAPSSPLFYGWIVAFVATLGMIATSPGQTYSVSLFIDYFIDDFGMERSGISGLYMVGTLFASFALTWVGRQMDLRGSRLVGTVVVALFAGVLLLMSLIAGPITLLIGFFAIRFLGQGSLFLISSTVIAQWFWRMRGRVMALGLIALSLFQAVYVPGLQRFLAANDWRVAWVALGIAIAVVVVPLWWLFIRNRPEAMGLLPDGDTTEPDPNSVQAAEINWTLGEAMQSRTFWVFLVAAMIPPAWVTGMVFHQVSIFEGLGFSGQIAAETFAVITLVGAGAALSFGWLVDRLSAGAVIALQLAALGVATVLTTIMNAPSLLLLYALFMGIASGSGGVIGGAIWANLFGRLHLGAIRGFVATSGVAASSVGPFLFGLSFDYLGGYDTVLWLGFGLCALAITASMVMPPPRKAVALS